MKTMMGPYADWADKQLGKRGSLSYLHAQFKSVSAWRKKARQVFDECLSPFPANQSVKVTVKKKFTYDSLDMELLEWQLPYGPKTEALFMKPSGAKGKLPGVLALHDHGGIKYYGYKKISKTGAKQNARLKKHQQSDYDGLGWANEIAKRGYAVLVHDTFLFGSRKVPLHSVHKRIQAEGPQYKKDSTAATNHYNQWAGSHESVMAKSIFCSGNTWPAYYLYEDQVALGILAKRKDVDANRLGTGGLSGGGLRTVMLAGTDDRIKACFCAGFMSTWRDFMLNKCHTHTWMAYIPLLPKYLDFPEILAMRAPLPTMVLNCNQDGLYTLPEMKKADKLLKAIYKKAGASDRYQGHFFDGGHQLTAPMQKIAFDWFDRWI